MLVSQYVSHFVSHYVSHYVSVVPRIRLVNKGDCLLIFAVVSEDTSNGCGDGCKVYLRDHFT